MNLQLYIISTNGLNILMQKCFKLSENYTDHQYHLNFIFSKLYKLGRLCIYGNFFQKIWDGQVSTTGWFDM